MASWRWRKESKKASVRSPSAAVTQAPSTFAAAGRDA
jgi:hypothetical protein